VRVVAPGSIPRSSGDRIKTDRRDAVRLVRLLAAGELGFASVPSVADECFRDLGRCIEDARGDLMRARHRLGTFLLRRDERYPGRGGAWTRGHLAWLGSLRFADECSRATFADYLAAVELLAARRATLIETLQRQVPESAHAPVIARLRCFRGIDTLSGAGLRAEIGDFARFPRPALLSGFLGIVPSEHTAPSPMSTDATAGSLRDHASRPNRARRRFPLRPPQQHWPKRRRGRRGADRERRVAPDAHHRTGGRGGEGRGDAHAELTDALDSRSLVSRHS
jgi:transposase